ncbi:MAG: hypothetical protein C0593_10900 [Marinilabiliales bacterium]|nr:MAG: hypothetical protein C0593_10900 [Marinilabiliales bacterium]
MILIADSGSTKTDWVLLEKEQTMSFVQTAGFNPYYSDPAVLKQLISEQVAKKISSESISSVFYYGSGCSTKAKQEIVYNILKKFYPGATIEVYHDLLGSARAVLGDNPGIACILGTGSNSCLYDGNDVIENVPSVGYFFGDEGSGTDFGKRLIGNYLRDTLPENVKTALEQEYDLSFEKAMDAIYNQPMPNRFFASFSPFIRKRSEDPFIMEIIASSFSDFFEFQVSKYSDYKNQKLCFVGSVAYHYRPILEEAASKFGMQIHKIIPNPVEGLIDYYREPSSDEIQEQD